MRQRSAPATTRSSDADACCSAGINQKLRADRLPESALAQKESLWSEATTFCETARAAFAAQRAPGARKPKPSWSDRFFFIHCCEAYEGIGRREDKRACFDEAHSAGIWRYGKKGFCTGIQDFAKRVFFSRAGRLVSALGTTMRR